MRQSFILKRATPPSPCRILLRVFICNQPYWFIFGWCKQIFLYEEICCYCVVFFSLYSAAIKRSGSGSNSKSSVISIGPTLLAHINIMEDVSMVYYVPYSHTHSCSSFITHHHHPDHVAYHLRKIPVICVLVSCFWEWYRPLERKPLFIFNTHTA